ncbi:unnamed protein product [Parajaminaea phylloscopi]
MPATAACPCLNIRVRFTSQTNAHATSEYSAAATQRVKLSDDADAVAIAIPALAGRELLTLPDSGLTSAVPALRCLHCGTTVYAVERPASSGPTRSVGFQANGSVHKAAPDGPAVSAEASPSRSQSQSSRDATSLRPHDGLIFLLPDLLTQRQVDEVQRGSAFSPIYGISVSARPTGEWQPQGEHTDGASRPSMGQQRRSSIGSLASTTQYALPIVPSHLISSPLASPAQSYTNATSSLLTSAIGSQDPLANSLDAVGLEKLKQWRLTAEQDILDLVRQKRKELDAMVRRATSEGAAIIDRSKRVPAPAPRGRPANSSSALGRSRDSSVAAPVRAAAADRSSSTALVDSVSSSIATASEDETYAILPSNAFQRRRPVPGQVSTASSTGQANLSSSLSALSASFATRGNDRAGLSVDEWAQKRRLKERYPEGDHSVMTSAATSAANSDLEEAMEDSEADDEEDVRGRGRQRGGRGSSVDYNAAATHGNSVSQRHPANLGTPSQAPGTKARPTMAPSSLSTSSKALASTSLDYGQNRDSDTPQPGGRLGLPPSDSADVHLRPRNPPPSGAEPLKPATRKGSARSQNDAARPSEAKKVAFAEVPDHGQAAAQDAELSDSDDAAERSHEPETAVFDIDEEMDDQAEAGMSAEDVVDPSDSSPQRGRRQTERVPSTELERSAALLDLEEDEADELGGMRASFGAQQAGSLSALAASLQASQAGRQGMSQQQSAAEDLDPASLRIDSRGSFAPQSLSFARGSAGNAWVDAPATLQTGNVDQSDTIASSPPQRKMASHDWGGRAAIGYRTIGDVEMRLSGLLAPHAPSHRALWSAGVAKRKIAKYKIEEDVEEEDDATAPTTGQNADPDVKDSRWSAWQQRARNLEEASAKLARQTEQGNGIAQSLPSGRRSDLSTSIGIPMAPRQKTSTIQYDGTSGFDREPKTSLPYQERQMVPSLRKATRRAFAPSHQTMRKPILPTIADEADSAEGTEVALAEQVSAPEAPARDAPTAGGAAAVLGTSLVTRGFDIPGQESSQGASQPPGADPRDASLAAAGGSAQRSGGPALSPALSAGAWTPGSSKSGNSGPTATATATPPGRRSPRPPYVAPPPPTSTSTVLEPDPAHKPAALRLFKDGADSRFAYNEEGEEEETEWTKVLAFMHRVEQLKINKRTGWLHHRVPRAESIADHMYRMAMLAMLCPNDIDIGKAVMLALVHDLAEAEVGDLTPLDKVPKEEKVRREAEALAYLVHDLLGSSPAALRIEALWHEYEERETLESQLVKDLDRFELILQATEYERAHDIVDLQPFFSCAGDIRHPRVRKWTVELAKERQAQWKAKGGRWAYEQAVPSDAEVRGDARAGVDVDAAAKV